MAQGVAFVARALGIPATVLLTKGAAATKVAGLERLGARIRYLSDAEWWGVIRDHGHPNERGLFVHPVANRDVLAGDATVGLEIYEQLPEVDTVLVPFGGGGLATGIASAMRALKPGVRVLGAESDHCAPLTAAIEAGEPVETTIRPIFLSGIGVGRVLSEMWPLVKDLLAGAVVAQEREIVEAIRFLCERHHVIAEGAGAAGVASALAGRALEGNVVCVVSGGNLDRDDLLERFCEGAPRRGTSGLRRTCRSKAAVPRGSIFKSVGSFRMPIQLLARTRSLSDDRAPRVLLSGFSSVDLVQSVSGATTTIGLNASNVKPLLAKNRNSYWPGVWGMTNVSATAVTPVDGMERVPFKYVQSR